jgi:hypothetical protein
MTTELLWKRAVRRGIESARRESRRCDFDDACELSAIAIDNLRRFVANDENIRDDELRRRMSRYLARRAQMEQRMAESWRQVMVTK